jgi:arginine decarboxylase
MAKTQKSSKTAPKAAKPDAKSLVTPPNFVLGAVHDMFVPKAMFFTDGVGTHKDYLTSFELALRDAGVETANLVTVSSIFPPHCRELSRKEGQKLLRHGQMTNEPNRLIAASIGLAKPTDPAQYGYLSEHHSYGETAKKAGDYAEDLAATMLATTLGVPFDPDKAWDERKQEFHLSKQIVKTRSIVQSAEGNKDGKWTTVVSLGVFIF